MGSCLLKTLMSESPQKEDLHAGEAKTVNGACPLTSPFTAVNGVEGSNGQKGEEAHHAGNLSHDTSESEGKPVSRMFRADGVVGCACNICTAPNAGLLWP